MEGTEDRPTTCEGEGWESDNAALYGGLWAE
jgi:hypothetical protein